MKKTFALVLAVAMVMSLAAVSFAANTNDNADFTIDSAAKKYSSDSDTMSVAQIQYGKAAYFGIYYKNALITEYKHIEKIKVKAKWEMGSDLVESVSIVKKLVSGSYNYYVEVKTAFKSTTTDADIIGTLTFNKKKSDDSSWILDDLDKDITINVGYEESYLDSSKNLTISGDREHLKWDTYYLIKFDYDDEVELSFGPADGTNVSKAGDNEGTFTVDVSGQGKVLLYYLTTANEDIANANPGAKLKFINFNNVKFNRTGEFMYEMEDGAYAYQIVDGKLVAIPGCEYDDADEAFYFNTRTLGSYVFSDVELVDAAVEAPVVTAPVETNPSTGAAA